MTQLRKEITALGRFIEDLNILLNLPTRPPRARSKYMPHIGKKERARYAVPSHGREATE